jgi:hypothetical protein
MIAQKALFELAQLYKRSPEMGKITAAKYGVTEKRLKFELLKSENVEKYFGRTHELLPGWSIGVRDGQMEAAGTKAPPGALALSLLAWKFGKGYTLGRQHALANAGLSGGTKAADGILDLLHGLAKKHLANDESEEGLTT